MYKFSEISNYHSDKMIIESIIEYNRILYDTFKRSRTLCYIDYYENHKAMCIYIRIHKSTFDARCHKLEVGLNATWQHAVVSTIS